MRMKFDGCNGRVEIMIGDGASLSARRRATVEHVRAASHESSNELRGFVLNDTECCADRRRLRNVAVPNLSSECKESAGSQFDTLGAEPLLR